MDPLSGLLAVITLATAIKDMVELAEKIHASFEKVSDNLRNAQVLASEIKQTIYELKEFCEQHYATLDDDKELKGALLDLIAKLKLFHSNTVPLLPGPSSSSSPRLLHRVKGGFKAWKNGDRIDASIRELKEDVKKCQMNFMMMSVARIQVKLNEMHRSTSEDLQVIQQGVADLLVTHNPTISFALHSPSPSSPSQKSIEPSNRNIVAFAQTSSSTSTPMWKTPSAMKDQIIWDTYLKGQIDSISKSLRGISTLDTTYSIEPLEAYASPFAPMVVTSLRPEYCDPESLHRDVVVQSLQIRKTLENQPTSTSVQEGAWSLVDLSIGLHYLGMSEEAATMGKWAVELFRALAAVDGATYSPFLAHSLKHLSHFYTELDDMDAAFSAIQEAVNVSRSLQSANTPLNLRVQYSAILTIYAKHVSPKDHRQGVELASESLKHMERIIDVERLPVPYSKDSSGALQVNRIFLNELYRLAPSEHAIVEYARALRELSDCLVRDEQFGESLDLKLFALAIFYDLPMRISQSMNEELGGILCDVITQPTKSLLPPEKLLLYAEDYIHIIRKRVETNASLHGRALCNALWEKASLLNQLGRHDDAVLVWKEIADLAQGLIQDQLYYANALSQVSWSFRNLKRHEEAAHFRSQSLITYHDISSAVSPSQAYSYYDLCVDLQLAKRYDEAAQAARNAVHQSRALALVEDPHVWFIQTGRGKTALANSLLHTGEHTSAMDEGLEALQVFERLVSTDLSCAGYYLYALRVNLEIAMTVDDASASVTRFKDVVRRYQQLAVLSPEDVGLSLLEAEIDYGHNLDRLDRLTEARQHFEHLLTRWDSRYYSGHSEVQIAHLHISTHISYASILDNQGHTELALEQIIKGTQIGKPFCSTHPDIAGQTVGAMHRHAQLLVELGRWQEALAMAEETLAFSRTIQTDDLSNVVGAMHVVAIAADRVHSFKRVIQISQEAVDVCRGDDMAEYCQTDTRAFILLPRSLQFLSSGEADLGLSDGLKHAVDAVEEAEKLKSNLLMSSGDAEKSYMDARGHLGTVLFAHGETLKAREIFEERRVYLKNRVKERNGEYADLVGVLYKLGIMYCHDGRHLEGASMAQELSDTMSRLEMVFPGLHKLVKIDMRHEVSMPTLRDLQTFKTKLTCNHHSHISFNSTP